MEKEDPECAGLWKSLKVHFEGRVGISIGDADAAKLLRGEGSCSLSGFYRSWSAQCRRKRSKAFHSDEGDSGR